MIRDAKKEKRSAARRRWRRLSVGLLALAIALPASVVVLRAVHDTGAFELEGNAKSDTVNSVPPDDWDRVCHEAAPTGTNCSTTFNTTGTYANNESGATAVSWTSDNLLTGTYSTNASIFTGGGSKDPQDINQWAWKDGAGGLPDKDNLVHSFAARYSIAPSATCPSNGAATCEVLYFGSDRFDNSGDAQQGFWFFQNKVTLGNVPLGGGTNFNGLHKNGDLLVISDFSNGGSTSTISVYRWNTAVSGNLELLQTSNNANCLTAGGADGFCGIVNSTNGTPAPWAFVDKTTIGTNHPANTYLQGEFFEAGINLSKLGLANECFSSVLSETRSSTSTTATLKDFVLGQFAVCGANIVTSPSLTSVSPGQQVTDTATVSGTGLTAPPEPTGNVTFRLCGPTDTTSTTLCSSSTGSSLGSVALDGGASTTDGIATATSSAVNTAQNPLTPGRYCFYASWPGDNNYTSGPFEHAGDTSGSANGSECFVVVQLSTTTVTTPSDSSGIALAGPVPFGTELFDKAVVTGVVGGGNPLGTVTFTVCNPNQLTNGLCPVGTALGTQVGSARTLVAVAASNPPSSSVLSSPAVTANIAGKWCFNAVFTPSNTIYTGSSDGRATECVEVAKAPTTTVTTPSSLGPIALNGGTITDTAIVTAGSTADGDPTGTVTFFVCSPSQTSGAAGAENCAAGAGTQVGNAVTLVGIAALNGFPRTQATSASFDPTVVGVWCFRAVYTPGGANGDNYLTSADAGSHSECFLVTDTTSASSAQTWLPNDSATITSAGGAPLNGKLSFTLYEGGTCEGTILRTAEEFTLTNATTAADRTKTTTNSTVKVEVTKTVSWKVEFTSNDSNVGNSTHCEITVLTITN